MTTLTTIFTERCPERGEDKFERGEWRNGNEEHICQRCGQSWFPDVDYSKKVQQ